jgi:hypothetical protein
MTEQKKPIEYELAYQLGSAIYIIESLTGIDSKTLEPLKAEKGFKTKMLQMRKKNAKTNAIKFLENHKRSLNQQ